MSSFGLLLAAALLVYLASHANGQEREEQTTRAPVITSDNGQDASNASGQTTDDDSQLNVQLISSLVEWLDKKKKKKKDKDKDKKPKPTPSPPPPPPTTTTTPPPEPHPKPPHYHDKYKHKKGYHGGYDSYESYHDGYYNHDKHYSGKHSYPLLGHHFSWDHPSYSGDFFAGHGVGGSMMGGGGGDHYPGQSDGEHH